MKKIFQSNNKKLLDEIMSKNEGIIECSSVIDLKDIAFDCEKYTFLSEGDEEYSMHIFI